MNHSHGHIPIQPASAPSVAGCGGCGTAPSSQPCGGTLGPACLSPQLSGPSELLRQAIDSLRLVVDPDSGHSLVDLHLVQSLHIDEDEAELTVTFPRACGCANWLAEEAFHSLRSALPDTDIYVRHAA